MTLSNDIYSKTGVQISLFPKCTSKTTIKVILKKFSIQGFQLIGLKTVFV